MWSVNWYKQTYLLIRNICTVTNWIPIKLVRNWYHKHEEGWNSCWRYLYKWITTYENYPRNIHARKVHVYAYILLEKLIIILCHESEEFSSNNLDCQRMRNVFINVRYNFQRRHSNSNFQNKNEIESSHSPTFTPPSFPRLLLKFGVHLQTPTRKYRYMGAPIWN